MASHKDFVDYVAEQLREAAFPHLPKAPPYEGANDYIWVEDVDDRDTLTDLTRLTCLELQAQPKKRRK